MKNETDYSQYRCPYAHLEKECGHELHGPECYENTYGVWCNCGFRGPVFYLDPEELGLKKKAHNDCVNRKREDGFICPWPKRFCMGTPIIIDELIFGHRHDKCPNYPSCKAIKWPKYA